MLDWNNRCLIEESTGTISKPQSSRDDFVDLVLDSLRSIAGDMPVPMPNKDRLLHPLQMRHIGFENRGSHEIVVLGARGPSLGAPLKGFLGRFVHLQDPGIVQEDVLSRFRACLGSDVEMGYARSGVEQKPIAAALDELCFEARPFESAASKGNDEALGATFDWTER